MLTLCQLNGYSLFVQQSYHSEFWSKFKDNSVDLVQLCSLLATLGHFGSELEHRTDKAECWPTLAMSQPEQMLLSTYYISIIGNTAQVTIIFSRKLKEKRKKEKSVGMVLHAYNPRTMEVGPKSYKFKTSLGYLERPYFRVYFQVSPFQGFSTSWQGSSVPGRGTVQQSASIVHIRMQKPTGIRSQATTFKGSLTPINLFPPAKTHPLKSHNLSKELYHLGNEHSKYDPVGDISNGTMAFPFHISVQLQTPHKNTLTQL